MEIDKLIETAQTAVNQSTEADRPASEAYLKALQDAKERQIGFSQDELNSVGKQEREKAESSANEAWQNTLGMSREEAESILGDMSDEELQGLLPETEENSEESESETMSERIKSALAERDQALEGERERITSLSKSLYSERVENGLKNALRDKGLKDGRFDLARKLSGESDLVEKMMDGEQLDADAFSKAAESLYESSPEWFRSDENGNGSVNSSDGSRVINGVTVRESVGIPRTPDARTSTELTDEQRAERAASAY